MKLSEKIEYWMDIADYDITTAQAMHKNGRYLEAPANLPICHSRSV